MAEFVYLVCGVTSSACAALLIRSWRATRKRLLLWSSLCFAGLALNNVLLYVDLVLMPEADLSLLRGALAVVALLILVGGLIWEAA